MSVVRVLSVPHRTVLASRGMNKLIAVSICLLVNTNVTNNERRTLLPDSIVANLSQELSGEIAKISNAQEIRDIVSATYGPVPLEYVSEYCAQWNRSTLSK